MLCGRQLTSSNDGVVSRIYVDGLVERERHVVSVQSLVQALREVRDWSLRKACNELLDVADALCSGGRVSRAVAVPQLQVC